MNREPFVRFFCKLFKAEQLLVHRDSGKLLLVGVMAEIFT